MATRAPLTEGMVVLLVLVLVLAKVNSSH